MKKQIILTIFLMSGYYIATAQADRTIDSLLNQYVLSSANKDAGMIVGIIDCNTEKIKVFSKGSINKDNDLRLVCPASKPAISYLILKNGINILSTIDKWFPLKQGYQKSDKITIKMLLSNTSGIKDYVELLSNCKQAGSAQLTIDTAYKNKELAFNPGDSVLYSNTGFNVAGIILEKETHKNIDKLLSEHFKVIAPSIRMDNGHGNYPKGYVTPWPYHYSLSGYSGGLIGTIEDYLRMMAYISKQPEFKTMTDWVKVVNGWNHGLGIEGEGNKIIYPGNSGANLSWLIKIDSKIIYIHTTNDLDNNRFNDYADKLISFLSLNGFGQEKTLKEQALEKFKSEHYDEAIALLEQAAKETPKDAEIFYYLGWFNHYRAYDSRPLSGYNFSYSEQIFKYLDKALELNPDYGDARYFYGAECSGNAFIAMQNNDAEKLKCFYKLANDKGAYPAWLKEFGRNFLNNCDANAILFTGGNADFDVCLYLQLHENFRTDITLLPIGNIDRPWYVKFLKNGLKDAIKKVDLNLTDQQIMDIHPFKWDKTTVSIQVSPADKKQFDLNDDNQLKWQVEPDLFSERLHSKIESEKAKKLTYLSPQKALLLQVVEDNFYQRPIYFSNFCSPTLYGGLNVYFQNCGLVSRLTPILTKDTDFAFNHSKMEEILREQNLINFKTLINSDMPRISGVIVSGYYNTLRNLSEKYSKTNDKKGKIQLKQLFEKHLKIGYNTDYENETQKEFEN